VASIVEIEFIVQEEIAPIISAATDRHLMRAVRRGARGSGGVLRVYRCPGDLISLGRYNLVPAVGADSDVSLFRRHAGGRLLPFGDGFVGLSLILPHRSAIFSSDPLHLSPHQVINRYVRGILEAFTALGVGAFYPGRDLVTVDRQAIGAVSFETDEDGTLLFEAVIANDRDFSVLGELLAKGKVDEGMVRERVLPESATTSLGYQLGTTLSLLEVAAEIRRGFAKQFDLTFRQRELMPLEKQAISALANRQLDGGQWLFERRLDADLHSCGSVLTQLGRFEAHLALQNAHIIKRVTFAGDFIANSPAVIELERELKLCPAKWGPIEAVVRKVFSQPQNFILGIGRLRTVVDTILRGVA